MATQSGYRDLSELSSILKSALWLYVVVAAGAAWSQWLEMDLFSGALAGAVLTEGEAAASDRRQFVVGIAGLATLILSAILFLRWTYLSRRNVDCLGNDGLRFSPRGAVGWYFVPVLSAWKPYQALKEIFQASHPDVHDDWSRAPRPRLMPFWWALWIVTCSVSGSTFRLWNEATTPDAILQVMRVELALRAGEVVLALALISLVSTLQSWQGEKHRRTTATISLGDSGAHPAVMNASAQVP